MVEKLRNREANGSDGPGEAGRTDKKSSTEPSIIHFDVQVLGLIIYLRASF